MRLLAIGAGLASSAGWIVVYGSVTLAHLYAHLLAPIAAIAAR